MPRHLSAFGERLSVT